MARHQSTLTLEFLTTFLPDFLIEKYARALGVVERDRKVDPVLLVWTLILGFPAGAKRTLASLRRRFQQAAGLTVARSSFHARLTRPLAELLKKLVDWRLSMGRHESDSEGGLAGFKELLALDSTVVQLHKMLAPQWQSTDPDGAAAKLHMVTNVVSGSPNRVQLTGQRTSDVGPWKTIGSWVTDCLLLIDLGYYEFHLFWRIDQKGGSYLSRAKSNANPRIVGSNQAVRGNAIDLVGHKLQDVLGRLKRRFIDVEVEVPVKLRKYRGTRSTRQMRMRLVGVRNDETGDYHLYFTNIDADTLTPATDCPDLSAPMAGRAAVHPPQNHDAAQPAAQLEARSRRGAHLRRDPVGADVERLPADTATARARPGLPGSTHGCGVSRRRHGAADAHRQPSPGRGLRFICIHAGRSRRPESRPSALTRYSRGDSAGRRPRLRGFPGGYGLSEHATRSYVIG